MLCDDLALMMESHYSDQHGYYRGMDQWKRQYLEENGIPFLGDDRSREIESALSAYREYRHGIHVGQRFVLSPMVKDAALEFARSQRSVNAALDHIFLPAETCWIEWRGAGAGYANGTRHGLLLIGHGEGKAKLSVGRGLYVVDPGTGVPAHLPVVFDLHDFIMKPAVVVPGFEIEAEHIAQTRSAGRFLVCVLALINTPRVSRLIPHPIDKKLNLARVKRGKIPLLSWSDVTIRPDVGWVPQAVHEEGATGEKRRHHVRTFMRLKMGKVEIVKPHWRGNRDKGYVLHRHVVRMDGEAAGRWKGEPLPGPQILKPGMAVAEGFDS